MKPTLYLGLDGPVLVPHDHNDTVLPGVKVVDYAEAFINWAAEHFKVVFLTDRFAHEAFAVSNKIGLPKDKVSVMGFDHNRTDRLPTDKHFAWVDGELLPGEVRWLGEHNLHDRFIQVDSSEGVTEEHKKSLEKLLQSFKRT